MIFLCILTLFTHFSWVGYPVIIPVSFVPIQYVNAKSNCKRLVIWDNWWLKTKSSVTNSGASLTLNLFPTLMKPSFPALCLESLLVAEVSNSSLTKLSLDSHTKLSKDMWRASLFFSTNRVCWHQQNTVSIWLSRKKKKEKCYTSGK